MTDRDKLRLTGVHPDLISKVSTILDSLPMFVVEGVRSDSYQHSLWMKGRNGDLGKIVTNCDGIKVRSHHQIHPDDGLGHAVDLAFIPTPILKSAFDPKFPWDKYGALAESLNLTWGGRFALIDLDHIEMKDSPLPSAKGH